MGFKNLGWLGNFLQKNR